MRSRSLLAAAAAVAICVATPTGCFYDTDQDPADVGGGDTDTDADTDADGGGDGGDTGDVSGVASIAEGLDAASYAVADLYLVFMEECPSLTNMSPTVYASYLIEDQDFSTAGASHAFAVQEVPAGQSFLWGFLDNDGSVADPEEPIPDGGDVMVNMGECFEVSLEAGGVVTDASLTLSYPMPDM